MPWEYSALARRPALEGTCSECGAPLEYFLRGLVQRGARPWWRFWGPERPYCAIICHACKEIIGYEHPLTGDTELKRDPQVSP